MPRARSLAPVLLALTLIVLLLLARDTRAARIVLAALPIAFVLVLMIGLHWGGHQAGPAGLLAGLLIAALAFGLSLDVLWVSQAKGVLIALFVLAILWPALLLYNVVNQVGGITAIAHALEAWIVERGILLIVVAWAFSGMLEGLAGFGLPVAIISPILVGMGVAPVTAVAAVAVGHAWSVTFGDMGVIYQTLTGLVEVDNTRLASESALLLGAACLACGLAAARILGLGRRWPAVIALAVIMSAVQYALVVGGLVPLGALGAGFAGIVGGAVISRPYARRAGAVHNGSPARVLTPALASALLSYGALTVLLTAIVLIGPLNDALRAVGWQPAFAAVETRDGFETPAGTGQALRPLVHPGSAILLVALLSYAVYRRRGLLPAQSWRSIAQATQRSALPASIGVVAMVGLSTLMEHTGMTQLLAEALSDALDRAFPLVSPVVGILGAFATGSNNNSNVLFAPLQESVAELLSIAPALLVAAQTTGGSIGSMLAPAKIMVGSSTVGLHGRDGEVLRITLPYGLLIGLSIGLLTLALAQV